MPLPLPLLALGMLCALGISGCSPRAAQKLADAAAFASPSDLTATLVQSAHVDLTWKNHATETGGNWLEFTTPGDDFVKIDAVWFDTTAWRHPDVAPDATFIYRLVPFFGRASEVVSIATGQLVGDAGETLEEEGPLPEPSALEAAREAGRKSIRSTATIAEAAPSEVVAGLSSATSVELRWKDRASDEDGYLVEIALAPEGPFQICALLPPDSASFRKTHLPPATDCYFRVRAFFYGEPSNPARTATPTTASRGQANH